MQALAVAHTLRVLLTVVGALLVLALPTAAFAHGGPDLIDLLRADTHAHHAPATASADAEAAVTDDDHCGCADCSSAECGDHTEAGGFACSDCPTCDNHVGPSPHPHALPATLLLLPHGDAVVAVSASPPSHESDGEPRPPFIPPRFTSRLS